MTGTKKEKKLLLGISMNDFLSKMNFHSNEEKESCVNYLTLKGVAYHAVLANYIGLNSRGKIEYKKISVLYQYDKRLRNILYKFLSAFEEGVRAYICNKYISDMISIKKLSKPNYDSIVRGSSLPRELENLDFNKLINVAKKLRINERIELFGTSKDIKTNLDAIRELRNAVSHHRQLFVYDSLNDCVVDNKSSNSLIDNVKNLYNYLPSHYKEFFRAAINKACEDKDDPQFRALIPKKALLEF